METPKTKREVETKEKQKVSTNTDTGSGSQAPNINKIPAQKPKPQQIAFPGEKKPTF